MDTKIQDALKILVNLVTNKLNSTGAGSLKGEELGRLMNVLYSVYELNTRINRGERN